MLASSAATLCDQRGIAWHLPTPTANAPYVSFSLDTREGTYVLPVSADGRLDGNVFTAILTSHFSKPSPTKPKQFYPPRTGPYL